MASELRYLQQRYDESTFNRTWKGQLFILMRHATGFYGIFRSLIVSFYDHIRDFSQNLNCPVSPSRTLSFLPHTPKRRPTPVPPQISSPPLFYYSYQTRHLQLRRTSPMPCTRLTLPSLVPSSLAPSNASCTVQHVHCAPRPRHETASRHSCCSCLRN